MTSRGGRIWEDQPTNKARLRAIWQGHRKASNRPAASRVDRRETEPERPRPGPTPGYSRRLSDKVLVAFHQACDERDFEVAEWLLGVLEMILNRVPPVPDRRRHDMETALVAAYERLWQLRHPNEP